MIVGVLTSKWMILFYALIIILIMLYMAGRKSVHTEIIIPASPKAVWSVLTDIQDAKKWNRVLILVEGELTTGTKVKYEFRQDDNKSSVIPATVKQVIENKRLNQTGGLTGILTFNHNYILESAESGTKVIIHEDYRGVMVPFWNPAPVEEAYRKLANALKDRVVELDNRG